MKNEEKNDKLFSEMKEHEMKTLLKELADTRYWQAILRLNRIKDSQALNSLSSIDPFKDPTGLARTQGIRIGMFYIEQEILRLMKESEEKVTDVKSS